jgi:putative heme-binding domain-containing protein
MPLRRFLLPWATPKPAEIVTVRRAPELAGGDWRRGKELFFSEQAACSKCHQVAGQGGKIGPDLSSLTQRDYASVLKDILEPSAAINPDHLAYNVELKDADALTGVILDDKPDSVELGLVNGQTISISKQRIKSSKPSAVSLMPEGLFKTLTPQQQKDLLTFLLTVPGAN